MDPRLLKSLDQRGYTRAGVSYLPLEPDILSGMSLASLISGVPNGEILHRKVLVSG